MQSWTDDGVHNAVVFVFAAAAAILELQNNAKHPQGSGPLSSETRHCHTRCLANLS